MFRPRKKISNLASEMLMLLSDPLTPEEIACLRLLASTDLIITKSNPDPTDLEMRELGRALFIARAASISHEIYKMKHLHAYLDSAIEALGAFCPAIEGFFYRNIKLNYARDEEGA